MCGGGGLLGLITQSGSLAIISNRVGLDRVGGGDIGLRRPAVRTELNLVREEGKGSCAAESMGFDDVSGGEGGGGGGGGGGSLLAAAGQHQEWWGETTMVGPSLLRWWSGGC